MNRTRKTLREWVRMRRSSWVRWRMRKTPKLLVLQIGKVGSSSVVQAVNDSDAPFQVLHLHMIAKQSIDSAVDLTRKSRCPVLDEHLIESMLYAESLRNSTERLKVITMTREPIGRAVSFVFQAINRELGLPPYTAATREAFRDRVIQRLNYGGVFTEPKIWFDSELTGPLGVDVFSTPFCKEAGFSRVSGDLADLLCLRMEDLGCPEVDVALSEFVGAKCRVSSVRKNTGKTKQHGDLYREMVKSFKVPRELAEKVYGSEFCRHFYPEEISGLMERWT